MLCIPRTICPQFQKYEFGICTGILASLEEYSEQLKDMVTFIMDCSFSIDEALEQAGMPRRDPAGPSYAGAYKVKPYLWAERLENVDGVVFLCGGENIGTGSRSPKVGPSSVIIPDKTISL